MRPSAIQPFDIINVFRGARLARGLLRDSKVSAIDQEVAVLSSPTDNFVTAGAGALRQQPARKDGPRRDSGFSALVDAGTSAAKEPHAPPHRRHDRSASPQTREGNAAPRHARRHESGDPRSDGKADEPAAAPLPAVSQTPNAAPAKPSGASTEASADAEAEPAIVVADESSIADASSDSAATPALPPAAIVPPTLLPAVVISIADADQALTVAATGNGTAAPPVAPASSANTAPATGIDPALGLGEQAAATTASSAPRSDAAIASSRRAKPGAAPTETGGIASGRAGAPALGAPSPAMSSAPESSQLTTTTGETPGTPDGTAAARPNLGPGDTAEGTSSQTLHRGIAERSALTSDGTLLPSATGSMQPPTPASLATTATAAPLLTATAAVPDAAVPPGALAMQIAMAARSGRTSFDIRLDPAELGRIDVRLEVDRHGQITSHLTVEKPETLAMLRQDAPQLQRALNDAGLKTADGALQFSLSDQPPSRHHGGEEKQAQRLIIHDDEIATAALAGRGYGRLLAARSGVDIMI